MPRARHHRLARAARVGPAGAAALAERSALVVGCGALGSAVAQLLVRTGIGRLRLVDRDVVEEGNLGDQLLFTEADAAAGRPKAEAAAERLAAVDGEVRVEAFVDDFAPASWRALADGMDVIVDASDNLETKYLLNDVSVSTATPWVYAGCAGAWGTVLAVVPGRRHCLRCLWPDPPAVVEGCAREGLLPMTAAAVAALQATEALKLLMGREAELFPGPVRLDVWDGVLRRVPVAPWEPDACPACGRGELPFLDAGLAERADVLCGGNTVLLSRGRAGAARAPADAGPQRFDVDGCRVLVFASGRALVVGTDSPLRARALLGRCLAP